MRRPTRTRRLSIAAIVSLLAFAAVGAAGVRSLWMWDIWNSGSGLEINLVDATIICRRDPEVSRELFEPRGHTQLQTEHDFSDVGWWFHITREIVHSDTGSGETGSILILRIPLWFLLLLLLIVPVRWLIARPANSPAFPVITDELT